VKKSHYSESQIISILKEASNAVPVSELCQTHGMRTAAFYQWRSKYGGVDASLISEMKHLLIGKGRQASARLTCLLATASKAIPRF
jgi:hypothetical protein